MSNPYDGPVGEHPDPYLPPMSNCAECGNAYAVHILNEEGVCPKCLLTVMEMPPNPIFSEPAGPARTP